MTGSAARILRRNIAPRNRRRRGKAGRSWYVDETYIKVGDRWCYLYRAIDRSGALIDVLLSERRDMKAKPAHVGLIRWRMVLSANQHPLRRSIR